MIVSSSSSGERSDRPNIVVERTYQAHVQELWELWTTKDGFESWWGPEGFRVEVHALEPRLGGTLYYEMIAESPEMVAAMRQLDRPASHESRCTYSQFQPFERLALTHWIDFLPGVAAYENTMFVEFFPSGNHVRMVVTLTPMHDEEITQMSLDGFTSQLTKLDRRFTARGTAQQV